MVSFTVFKGHESGFPKQSTTQRPDELVGDQVLVKVTASGMCGTDLHYVSRDGPAPLSPQLTITRNTQISPWATKALVSSRKSAPA